MNVNMIKNDILIYAKDSLIYALNFMGFSMSLIAILGGSIYGLQSTCIYGETKKALLEMELYKGKSATVEYVNKKRIESRIYRESSPQMDKFTGAMMRSDLAEKAIDDYLSGKFDYILKEDKGKNLTNLDSL